MGAGTKDKMPLIIAARRTERWRAGEWGGGWAVCVGGWGQGALVCKPDTLAVTVNKLTERKTVRQGEVGVSSENQERGNEQWKGSESDGKT